MSIPDPSAMPPTRPEPPRRKPVRVPRAPWSERHRHGARWFPSGEAAGTPTAVAVSINLDARRPYVRLTIDGVGSLTFRPGRAFSLAAHLARAADDARDANRGTR